MGEGEEGRRGRIDSARGVRLLQRGTQQRHRALRTQHRRAALLAATTRGEQRTAAVQLHGRLALPAEHARHRGDEQPRVERRRARRRRSLL